jgi:hypothetical protein
VDIVRSEAVESDLDRLITRRHDQRVSEEQGRIEDGWAESARTLPPMVLSVSKAG